MAESHERLAQPKRRMRLDAYLREHVQRYRVALLLRCGEVVVERRRRRRVVKDAKLVVGKSDVVYLRSPLSEECQRALARIPAREFRDYGYAAFVRRPFSREEVAQSQLKGGGRTPTPEESLYVALAHRPGMVMVPAQRDGLAGFIRYLRRDLRHPLRDIYLGAHSWYVNFLRIDSKEILDADDISARFCDQPAAFDRADVLPRPHSSLGAARPCRLHLKGCRLGAQAALPLVQRLKACLNWRIPRGEARIETITAPKFMQLTKLVRARDQKLAAIEYMMYDFRVTSKKLHRTRADVVAAFVGSTDITDVDGVPIASDRWTYWIPDEPWKKKTAGKRDYAVRYFVQHPSLPRNRMLDSVFTQELKHALVPRFSPFLFGANPYGPSTSTTPHAVSSAGPPFLFYVKLDLAALPGTEAEGKAAVRRLLLNDDEFKHYRPSYAMPQWELEGFTSLDEFIDANEYEFIVDPIDGVMGQGGRWEYGIRAPITKSGNRVYLNFFPHPSSNSQIHLDMIETDPRFFAAV